MANKANSKTRSREDLKKYFRNGEVPSEIHFASLIDSTINKQDDGFSKDEENGMILSASVNSGRFFSFYKSMDDLEPFFSMEKDEQGLPALKLGAGEPADGGDAADNGFFFHTAGNMGLGKRCDNRYRLDVKGFSATEGRIGTYKQGQVPADGKWHAVAEHLDNCQALEVVARTGKRGGGRFAILHALALSAYGGSRNRIRKTSAHYGYFWNKLNLRWKSRNTHDFTLEIKTNSNYGKNELIFFHITRLWDDETFLPAEYYH